LIAGAPGRAEGFELGDNLIGAHRVFGESEGLAAREFKQFAIAKRLSGGKRGVAVLARAEKFPWAAEFQVAFGDFEAIGGGDHGFQAFFGFAGDGLGSDKDAVGLFWAAADAPAKLVELREAEAIGVFDHHDGRVRDIHADFDDGGGDEDERFLPAEAFHDGFLFFVFQAAVEKTDAQIGKNVAREALEFGCRCFQFLLRFLDNRIDHKGLATLRNFALEKLPDSGELRIRSPASFDGRAAWRHFVDHGEIEITVESEREGAGDRSGGHDEKVGRFAFFDEPLAL